MTKVVLSLIGLMAVGLLLSACAASRSAPATSQQSGQRQMIADERTDAAAHRLMRCLLAYQKEHEARPVVPPQDFERMIAGACIGEKSDFRNASVDYFIRAGVRDGIAIPIRYLSRSGS